MSAPSWPSPTGVRRAEAATGTRHDRLQLDYGAAHPRPREDHLCGAQLQEPHLGDGPPAAPSTRRCSPSTRRRSSAQRRADPAAGFRADGLGGRAGHHHRAPGRHASRTPRLPPSRYATLNDVTARDFQNRTSQWLQGKSFEATTPLGPWLVTTDDDAVVEGGFNITCEVDGEVGSRATTSDLVFGRSTWSATPRDLHAAPG